MATHPKKGRTKIVPKKMVFPNFGRKNPVAQTAHQKNLTFTKLASNQNLDTKPHYPFSPKAEYFYTPY